VDRAECPPRGRELYAADLIGMSRRSDRDGARRGGRSGDGGATGTARLRNGEKESLVPITLVREVDEPARKITSTASEKGLFDRGGMKLRVRILTLFPARSRDRSRRAS